MSRHDFVRESVEAPDSVNPSLWRHARLNTHLGLFRVADGAEGLATREQVAAGDGSVEALQAIFDNLDVFTSGFAIVEP